MAVTERISCDVCGIERGPSNHWLMWSSCPASDITIGTVTFYEWGDGYDRNGHLCGEGCAGKLLVRKIAEWRGEPNGTL